MAPEKFSTKKVLNERGLAPKKALGQHFLVDDNIQARIAALVGSDDVAAPAAKAGGPRVPSRSIVEIGPGLGGLTIHLARRAPKLVAVERDREMIPVLKELFHADTLAPITKDIGEDVTIVEQDALAFDFDTLPPGNWSVVGNLPYQITSPLLLRFCHLPSRFVEGVFMVQLEVARRLVAKAATSDYGSLTVAVASHAHVELCFNVGRGAFVPPPNVDSAVVRLRRRTPSVIAPELFVLYERVVRASFAKRRKTLWNSLRTSINRTPHLAASREESAEYEAASGDSDASEARPNPGSELSSGSPSTGHIDDEQLRAALTNAAIDVNRRGETLTIDEFVTLTQRLAEVLAHA